MDSNHRYPAKFFRPPVDLRAIHLPRYKPAPSRQGAVTTLLSELGYTVPIRRATENIQELSKTVADPIFVAVAENHTRDARARAKS